MSFGLLHLQSSNFGIDKIPEGKILCNSIKGFSVVLFYSLERCQYSSHALHEFKKVVGTVHGINFCVLNIDKNMDTVRLSRTTITPIDGVPYIMLYYNGMPKQIYPENYEFISEQIKNFSATVSTNILRSISNMNQIKDKPKTPTIENIKSNSSIYYVGNPIRKRVTYLSNSSR